VKQLKLALIIAISNLILSAYYLFVGLKLSAMYFQFNAETPNPVFNKYFIGFIVLAILSFAYSYFLKRRVKRELDVSQNIYNLILLILSSPTIYLLFATIYALIIPYLIIPLIL